MKIAIASDHQGIDLKKEIIVKLKEENYEIIDCSIENHATDDYPDYAFKVCKEVINKKVNYGILICGSGIGMSIAANKIKGIRCAVVSNEETAKYTRLDNDANVIALSKNIIIDNAYTIIKTFLTTPFSNEERHLRRINKISKIEDGTYNEL